MSDSSSLKVSEFRFGLPLLAKDLIEQSAQRKTYILRVAYASVVYGIALYIYASITERGGGKALASLGQGGHFFQWLVGLQGITVALIVPALTCGSVTTEKERDTLGLLLLTKLQPYTIVIEKLLSRLVTMGTYQLISLPLFAVAYGMGGVEVDQIIIAIWMLFWWSAVVGAWGVLCSTWHRTTAGAFVAAYAAIPLVMCFTLSCMSSMRTDGVPPSLFGNARFTSPLEMIFALIMMAATLLGIAFPAIACMTVLLAMAQQFLVERAFLSPRNIILEMFKSFDRFFEDLNQRTTRGVILVHDHDFLPEVDPISWRETRKKSLGTVRYLFRLLVLLEAPLACAILIYITDSNNASFRGPTLFFLSLLWPISIVCVVVHTTSVLASERSRQTLDVLLVTPISERELVNQKLSGVRRLIAVLSVPFITMILFQVIWNSYVTRGLSSYQNSEASAIWWTIYELVTMALSTLIYLPLLMWLTFRMALRLKNQTQAVLSVIVIVIAICVLPLTVVSLSPNAVLRPIAWLSPLRTLFPQMFDSIHTAGNFVYRGGNRDHPMTAAMFTALHYLVALGLWRYLRSRALREFSSRVGRTEPILTGNRTQFFADTVE